MLAEDLVVVAPVAAAAVNFSALLLAAVADREARVGVGCCWAIAAVVAWGDVGRPPPGSKFAAAARIL